MDCSSVTSSATVRRPRAATSVSASVRRAVAYTVNPASCRRSAAARPMPDEHPVISTGSVLPTMV
jgi:hypothetical protein